MATVCKKCGVRTEMPERHAKKYARVHELLAEAAEKKKKLTLEAALKQVQKESQDG